jgi:hypothetical protein
MGDVRRVLEVLRDDWPRLAIEVLVLVAGITISFALDEWRTERGNRRTERRALELIRDDLVADSAMLATLDRRLAAMVRAHAALLDGPPADSIDIYMDLAISYVIFMKTDVAYEQLRQTGDARHLRNRKLFDDVVQAYNNEYTRAGEWDAINRDFVLDRMIPYLDDNAPFVDAGTRDGIALGMAPVYHRLIRTDRFRNLLRTERNFRDLQRLVYRLAAQRGATLLRDVRRELATADFPR